jgi:hypothetical protein
MAVVSILRAAGNSGNVWAALTKKIEITTKNSSVQNHGPIADWRILTQPRAGAA